MTTPTTKRLTVEEYLAFEKTSEARHEFVDGVLHAMAGESRKHKRIVRNLIRALDARALELDCELVFESTKLQTFPTKFRYPDVMVSCAPGLDEYLVENPCFIVEVLSESTAHTDLETKLVEYTRLPSLERYVIVSQASRNVIVYRRTTDGWQVEILESGGFEVPCLQVTLDLDQVYAGVDFTERD